MITQIMQQVQKLDICVLFIYEKIGNIIFVYFPCHL